MPGHVLFGEVIEWARLSREVLDEPAIEICKAEKPLNVSKVARFWPIGDGDGFTMIHAYVTRLNNHAEVFDVVAVELAFLGLQIQIVFFEML